MALKFYRKVEPANSPVLGNGAKCVFSTLNHVDGYFASDNAYVQSELERLMSEGRYGMSEITEAEFHRDFVEKKKLLAGRPLKPLWREEIAPRQVQGDTVFAPKGVAAAVEALPAPASTAPGSLKQFQPTVADAQPLVPGPVPTEFKPPTGKRAKIKPPTK